MNSPFVSIGLPAFKGKYFGEALASLKNQTYCNFEVLIQDDASPDDLKGILDEVCGGDGRFQYERNEKNSSPDFVRNWNRTVERANGDFFVLASDDDIYAPTFLEELLGLAERYPKVDLFYSPFDEFNNEGLVKSYPIAPEYESQVEYVYQLLIKWRQTIVPNYLIRMEALKRIGGFVDLPAAWSSDWHTWCRLSENGVVCAQVHLFKWRTSGLNISSIDSAYWHNIKLSAMYKGRALWQSFLNSLVSTNEDEEVKIVALKKQMIVDFETNSVEPQMLLGAFCPFVWYMVKRVLRRDCNCLYAIRRSFYWWKFRYRMWKVSRTKK